MLSAIGFTHCINRTQIFLEKNFKVEKFSCFFINRWATKVLVNSNEACDHGRKVAAVLNHFLMYYVFAPIQITDVASLPRFLHKSISIVVFRKQEMISRRKCLSELNRKLISHILFHFYVSFPMDN